MALSEHEITQIIKMHKCGAHPTLIAQFLRRDPRVILDTLNSQNIHGPWPKIPSTPLSPTIKAQARSILQHRTLLSVIEVVDTLKGGEPRLDPDKCNLLLRAMIEEREQLAATT